MSFARVCQSLWSSWTNDVLNGKKYERKKKKREEKEKKKKDTTETRFELGAIS